MNKCKIPKKTFIVITIFIAITIFCLWENNDIVTYRYDYVSSKISDRLSGYKIVQISDLHNKEFGRNQSNLLNIIRKEKPDMIVITGDIIDSNHTNIENVSEFVNGTKKISPVYFVSGNHEHWLDRKKYNQLMNSMEAAGVTILNNQSSEIFYKNDSFYLIGLDDRSLIDNTLFELVKNIDDDKLQILLAHEPQNIEQYSKNDVDLVFSGHAHGGQLRIPFLGGLVSPDQGFFPKYTAGEYSSRNTIMEVSRGLGNSIVPIRLFNRPEVVVVTLKN